MYRLPDFQRLMGSPVEPAPADQEGPPTGPAADWNGVAALIAAAQARLAHDLIGRIHAQPPDFFERLVVDVLTAMGYGAGPAPVARCLGRSWDGGIDGMIMLDELGFDTILIQAKRLKPGVAVPISSVRDFAGSLEAHQAAKGVMVTSSHFSPGAQAFCSRISRQIVLIDGARLAQLMIRHNIGVSVRGSVMLKEIDTGYFKPGRGRCAG